MTNNKFFQLNKLFMYKRTTKMDNIDFNVIEDMPEDKQVGYPFDPVTRDDFSGMTMQEFAEIMQKNLK